MAKRTEQLVDVHIDHHDFSYPLDASSRRTLPLGWRGPVTAGVARAMERDGAGKILAKPTPKKATKAKSPKATQAAPAKPKPADTSKPEPAAAKK